MKHAAFHLELFCFLTRISSKNEKNPDVPKYLNGLIQIIRKEKSIRHMWVKTDNSNKIQDMQFQKLT